MTTTNTKHIITVEVVGDAELKKFEREAERLGAKLRALNGQGLTGVSQGMNKVSGSSKQMRFALQNAGYQVQDFLVQVQSGTSAMRAFGQQAPQLVSAFGAWGIAIGVGVSALTAIAPLLIKTSNSAKDAAKAQDVFSDALSRFDGYVATASSSINDLDAAYGKYAETIRNLAVVQARIAGQQAQSSALDQAKALQEQLEDYNKLQTSLEKLQKQLARVNDQYDRGIATYDQLVNAQEAVAVAQSTIVDKYGLQTEQVKELSDNMDHLLDLLRKGDMSQDFVDTAEAIRKTVESSDTLSKTWGEFLLSILDASANVAKMNVTLEQSAVATRNIAAESNQFYDAMVDTYSAVFKTRGELQYVAKDIETASQAATRLARNMQAVNTAVANLSRMTGSLDLDTLSKSAELTALQAGASREAARAAGEYAVQEKILTDAMQNATSVGAINDAARQLDALRASQAANIEVSGQLSEELKSLDASLVTTGGAGATAATGIDESKRAFDEFIGSLERYMTPAQQAESEMTKLKVAFALFQDQLSPEQVELFNQAMEELGLKITGVTSELSQEAQIFQQNVNNAFSEMIEGTKSVEDAFEEMLINILQDIAEFLVSRQVASLTNMMFGSSSYLNTPVAPGPATASANLNTPRLSRSVIGTPLVSSYTPTLPTAGAVYNSPRMGSAASYSPSYSGGGGGTQVNVINNSGAEIGVSESTSADGMQVIDVLVERKVKDMIGRGRLDSTMSTTYGLRRRAV